MLLDIAAELKLMSFCDATTAAMAFRVIEAAAEAITASSLNLLLPLRSAASMRSCTARVTAARASLWPPVGGFSLDAAARALRSSLLYASAPMAPSPVVGKNAARATRAVRMLQLGCQCSGWYAEMLRQILVFTSNRPFGCTEVSRSSAGRFGEREKHKRDALSRS